jgi:hypothetical protein
MLLSIGEGFQQSPHLIPSFGSAEPEVGDHHPHGLARDIEVCVDGSAWFPAWDSEVM